MALFTGQKVVAVYNWPPSPFGIVMPEKGAVYTIRHIGEYPRGVGVLLVEIKNPPMHTEGGFTEPSFLAAGFKPVVRRKTDISVFTKMLKTKQREMT